MQEEEEVSSEQVIYKRDVYKHSALSDSFIKQDNYNKVPLKIEFI